MTDKLSETIKARGLLSTIHNLTARRIEIEWQISTLVRAAVAAGATWREVGEAVGVSGQAAHARFRPPLALEINPGQTEIPIE